MLKMLPPSGRNSRERFPCQCYLMKGPIRNPNTFHNLTVLPEPGFYSSSRIETNEYLSFQSRANSRYSKLLCLILFLFNVWNRADGAVITKAASKTCWQLWGRAEETPTCLCYFRSDIGLHMSSGLNGCNDVVLDFYLLIRKLNDPACLIRGAFHMLWNTFQLLKATNVFFFAMHSIITYTGEASSINTHFYWVHRCELSCTSP